MKPLRIFIQRLRNAGVVAYVDKDRLKVRNIPTWALRKEVEEVLPELTLIGLAYGFFGKRMYPVSSDPEAAVVQENRCRFCLEFRLYRCIMHKKGIPADVFPSGCKRFRFNDSVYF